MPRAASGRCRWASGQWNPWESPQRWLGSSCRRPASCQYGCMPLQMAVVQGMIPTVRVASASGCGLGKLTPHTTTTCTYKLCASRASFLLVRLIGSTAVAREVQSCSHLCASSHLLQNAAAGDVLNPCMTCELTGIVWLVFAFAACDSLTKGTQLAVNQLQRAAAHLRSA